jgi:hypothetical protein
MGFTFIAIMLAGNVVCKPRSVHQHLQHAVNETRVATVD